MGVTQYLRSPLVNPLEKLIFKSGYVVGSMNCERLSWLFEIERI